MEPYRFDARFLEHGLTAAALSLPEYAEPYRVLLVAEDAPLRPLLAAHPLLVADAPPDLRRRAPAFAQLSTRVTAPRHSQPPHRDHPHRPGDPRRFTLFWAERPRNHAHTFFIEESCADELADATTGWLLGNREAAEAAALRVTLFHDDPRRVTRYALPPSHVFAFTSLVTGDPAPWLLLDALARSTVTTRLLGNTEIATRLTEHLLARLGARAWTEAWERPRVVIADDSTLLHGRLGRGESGEGFFRVWLT